MYATCAWVLALVVFVTGDIPDPQVCLRWLGCMEGTTMLDYDLTLFEAFMGIPYALPPVGPLRFAAPVGTAPWDVLIKVKEEKPDCIQKNYLMPRPTISGKEDCLYLNIYRPYRSDTSSLLPVMVFIHGIGFFTGTASHFVLGPEFFMTTKKVILVTLAYRLGALGFLSTGDGWMPGNFGLKDQRMALWFVHNFIKDFGGDPNRVTLFGQSAGAVSVHLHMLSPVSAGLFQAAIVMSGSAWAPWALQEGDAATQARMQGYYAGIKNAWKIDTKQLTDALRKVDARTLVDSGERFRYWDIDPLTVFRPYVEPINDDAFLRMEPRMIIKRGSYKMVPWMTGMVPNEGALRGLPIALRKRKSFNENFDYLFGKLMELPDDVENKTAAVSALIDFYFKGQHEVNNNTRQGFINSITDHFFMRPLFKTLEHYIAKADQSTSPVYLYKFAYRGSESYSSLYTGDFNNYGVVHSDDLIYLFHSPLLLGIDFPPKGSTDEKVMREMVDNYVTFATTWKPKMAIRLKPCTKANFNRANKTCDYWMIVNKGKRYKTVVTNAKNSSRLAMWDSILPWYD